jgi:hypothetical protein
MLADVYSVTVGAMYAIGRADQDGGDPFKLHFQWFHDHVGFAAVTVPTSPVKVSMTWWLCPRGSSL